MYVCMQQQHVIALLMVCICQQIVVSAVSCYLVAIIWPLSAFCPHIDRFSRSHTTHHYKPYGQIFTHVQHQLGQHSSIGCIAGLKQITLTQIYDGVHISIYIYVYIIVKLYMYFERRFLYRSGRDCAFHQVRQSINIVNIYCIRRRRIHIRNRE